MESVLSKPIHAILEPSNQARFQKPSLKRTFVHDPKWSVGTLIATPNISDSIVYIERNTWCTSRRSCVNAHSVPRKWLLETCCRKKKTYVGSWLFSWCHSPARLASFRRCFCSKYWEAMGGWGFERNKCTLTAGKRFRIAEGADDDKGWKGVWVLVYSTRSHSLMYIYIDRLVPHLKMIAFRLAHTYICTLRTIPRNIFFTQDSIKQMPVTSTQTKQHKTRWLPASRIGERFRKALR